jgi:hypothetical protein
VTWLPGWRYIVIADHLLVGFEIGVDERLAAGDL